MIKKRDILLLVLLRQFTYFVPDIFFFTDYFQYIEDGLRFVFYIYLFYYVIKPPKLDIREWYLVVIAIGLETLRLIDYVRLCFNSELSNMLSVLGVTILILYIGYVIWDRWKKQV